MILLDTCVLYWFSTDPSKLSPSARGVLRRYPTAMHVSAISAFEVATNHHKQRVVAPPEPRTWFAHVLRAYGINCLPVSWEIATASASLPRIHADPSDRITIATAIEHSLILLTPDRQIANYPNINVVW